MSYEPCDRCNRPARRLVSVKTLAASFWSPSEWELWCDRCIQYAQSYDARREAALEKRWEERTGR